MGTRKQREKEEGLWIAQQELASAPGHPFYQRLNELLEAEKFDEFVESRCAKFYAQRNGRPSLTPGIYFRGLLIGYFEGVGADCGIAGTKKPTLSTAPLKEDATLLARIEAAFLSVPLDGWKEVCDIYVYGQLVIQHNNSRRLGTPNTPVGNCKGHPAWFGSFYIGD